MLEFDDMLEFADRLPDVRAVARGLLASDHADRERTLGARCGCSTSACSVSAGTATRATTDTSG